MKNIKKILHWIKKKKLNFIKLNRILTLKKRVRVKEFFISKIKLIMVVVLVIIQDISLV